MKFNRNLQNPALLALALFGLSLVSCDHTEVEGIQINHSLYENLSLEKQAELKTLVQLTLKKDSEALKRLTNFSCGGSAGCYDLGFVLTQLIYRVGEDDFVRMAVNLDHSSLVVLNELVSAGLEYGDNNRDDKMDDKKIEDEFPQLANSLKGK